MNRFVVLHGHFYQPPRENPWIEEIEVQDSAAPYHDWNQRIHAECYGPNSASRIMSAHSRIIDISNNYEHLSFNFGPTLLAWMERKAPETYRRVLAAGGNAIAQAYNHAILPLANRRDKLTQIRWGKRDFELRFGRAPAGMWLPECAVDVETLELLVEEGIQFTVLSPHSCARWRGGGDWQSSGVDPRRPYRVNLPNGTSIAVFFYDGIIAQKVAFGEALADRDTLIRQLEGAFDPEREEPQLVNVATDGETFGHHRPFGDMVLASAIERILREKPFELITYEQYLERFPPDHEAEIVSPSAWSCAHGVGRWCDDCGCTTPTQPGWHQKWRRPLRDALDRLRDRLADVYEREAAQLLNDPWAARDAYVDVVLRRDPEHVDAFLDAQAKEHLEPPDRSRALKLLEMQRHELLMYTSCGWFFDELSRPEPVQVLKYAMRAIQLAREVSGIDLEPDFSRWLADAPANMHGTGAQILEKLVRPAVTSLGGVLAHYAISSLFEDYPQEGRVYAYGFHTRDYVRRSRGAAQLAVGRVRIESDITRETIDASFGLLHFGGHDFHCAVGSDAGDHTRLANLLVRAFEEGSLTDVVHAIDRAFGGRAYGLSDLFLDERQKITTVLLEELVGRWRLRWERMFDENRAFMRFLVRQGTPAPKLLLTAAELALTNRLAEHVRELDWDSPVWGQERQELRALVEEASQIGLSLDKSHTKSTLDARILVATELYAAGRRSARETAGAILGYLDVAKELEVELDLWQAQTRLWTVLRDDPPADPDERDALGRLAQGLGFDAGVIVAYGTPAAAAYIQ